jgi:hypothetical protein
MFSIVLCVAADAGRYVKTTLQLAPAASCIAQELLESME